MVRVAWLLTHKGVYPVEPTMIVSLGHEVFVPKVTTSEHKSYAIDYSQLDYTLTIPHEVLKCLNTVNVYAKMDTDTVALFNQYFDVCICDMLVWTSNINFFTKSVYLRVFGRDHPHTYHQLTKSNDFGLSSLGPNVRFAMAYEEVVDHEPKDFQNKCVYLPLCLRTNLGNPNTTNRDRSIAFVCSGIDESPYYKNIYNQFTDFFAGLPYKVYGRNASNDKAIVGTISDDEVYYQILAKHKVMFYHSVEPRHIHYHPLESISLGVPVIFMLESLLGSFAIKIHALHGACKTLLEARAKTTRVLDGDQTFINELLEEQQRILKFFSVEYCSSVWRRNFAHITSPTHTSQT
jgi:hypothetical protein